MGGGENSWLLTLSFEPTQRIVDGRWLRSVRAGGASPWRRAGAAIASRWSRWWATTRWTPGRT